MKFKILFFIFFLFIPSITFGADCKYSGKISECSSALKAFTGKDKNYIIPGASIKSIEDFPCLQASPEKRVFQIAMDENFQEIDKELEENLGEIYESKDFYFGKDANYDYLDGINYIFQKKKYYKDKYYKACEKSLEESAKCIENPAYEENKESISVGESTNFLQGSSGNCYDLADLKTNVFSYISYNGLLLNREQVSKDQKKDYRQKERIKYDKVLDLVMMNLSYIERIWKAWPSKTKNPL